jgi:hypothetical protein
MLGKLVAVGRSGVAEGIKFSVTLAGRSMNCGVAVQLLPTGLHAIKNTNELRSRKK